MKSTFPYTWITFQSVPDFNTDFVFLFILKITALTMISEIELRSNFISDL